MAREVLIVTSLTCEAAPLRKSWDLTPLRENPLSERFQVFQADGVYVAVSGIGKVRSAIATSALLTGLFQSDDQPIALNIGIAGASPLDLPRGAIAYINKVRDAATNTRFYPDIFVRHNLPERQLDTYDHPVTTAPTEPIVVDMEGSGFMQAVSGLSSPSNAALLKVISDHCDGTRCTPEDASALISSNLSTIEQVVSNLRTHLLNPPSLSCEERALLDQVTTHAAFSLTQRIELARYVESLKAQGVSCAEELKAVLQLPTTTKEARNNLYHSLLHALRREVIL
jgi:nucleoside phosphorylase